jgi:hypothetical protein
VYGGIGSGKTSGSGRFISGMYLRAGYGGVVTCVKSEDVDLWQRYAAEHGRSKSLVLFNEDEGFNFLNYELARQGMDGIGSVTECLMRISERAGKLLVLCKPPSRRPLAHPRPRSRKTKPVLSHGEPEVKRMLRRNSPIRKHLLRKAGRCTPARRMWN